MWACESNPDCSSFSTSFLSCDSMKALMKLIQCLEWPCTWESYKGRHLTKGTWARHRPPDLGALSVSGAVGFQIWSRCNATGEVLFCYKQKGYSDNVLKQKTKRVPTKTRLTFSYSWISSRTKHWSLRGAIFFFIWKIWAQVFVFVSKTRIHG